MKYRTLVADPPWLHERTGVKAIAVSGRHGRIDTRRFDYVGATSPPYPMLTVPEIAALRVGELAAPNAHLYLWTTQRYLRDVWDVAEAWGFKGSSVLTWCKPPTGFAFGGTFMSTTEFCLFARRGSLPAMRRVDSQWFTWPRRRGANMHSAKPEAFLDLVESVSPGPYLELFARRQRLGWDTWGDEALQHVDLGASA